MFLLSFLTFLSVILWLWAIMDLLKSGVKNPNFRMPWLILILMFPIIGSIIYFQLKKNRELPDQRKFAPDFTRIRG
ncbi:PLDc N-terminal domain-containing protein [Autumnicola tepida]|uniref:PLDc N-terminal domain-containing protein n=1 Tax=Autumnicola tepida TaxID=3075595 RepID=UPI003D789B76